MKKHWHRLTPDPQKVLRLAQSLGCDPIIARLLLNRGFDTKDKIMGFLHPIPQALRSPFLIKDMEAAVCRIYNAIECKERILIFGDYDADGISATALLFEFLKRLGADVIPYIPHRIKEGYGLQPSHIEDPVLSNRVKVIISADCGSSSTAAIESAQKAGVDVIVTDHHLPPASLPRAYAVINPNRQDCDSGLGDLAGVGVVFYLIMALRKYMRDRHFWQGKAEPNLKALSDLVAIGTVADMVPLTAENRILSQMGLSVLNRMDRSGLRALIGGSARGYQHIEAEDISFKLGPRLNAAGRLAHANLALELLTEKDPAKAHEMAHILEDLNTQRQRIEKSILEACLKIIDQQAGLLRPTSIVLDHSQWHEGVIGIVASRLVRQFHRPVILLSVKENMAKGSGRSIPGIDIYQLLEKCSAHIHSFGGHAMAAGLSIRTDQIHRFRESFETHAAALGLKEELIPELTIDSTIELGQITESFMNQLDAFKPFGAGNPEPMFMTENVAVASARVVGDRHLQMRFKTAPSPSSGRINAIYFNYPGPVPAPSRVERMAFHIRWNRWNGNKTQQLVIQDMQ